MKLKTKYGDKTIEFEIKYRERRTMAIQIEPIDKILVISPKGLSEELIKEKVKSKGSWIVKKLMELKEVEYEPFAREFVNGEAFMYLGRNYSLEIFKDNNIKRPKINLNNGKFYITTFTEDHANLKKAMEKWYRKEAKKIIDKRVNFYIPKIEKEPNQVKIKEQKKKWGSCTSKGNIYFNWRTIMAPSNVIDYIVVHELCHLVYPGHSKNFWGKVESLLPDYKKRRKWLQKYGIRMDL